MRYIRQFKKNIVGLLIGAFIFAFVLILSIVSKVQYDSLIKSMKSIEATIIDIDLDIHVRGPDEQEIYITYEVDGVVYNRELKTDTGISFSAGIGAHYSIGDKVKIFYDPKNPEVIATPRSVSVSYFYTAMALIGLSFITYPLIVLLKNSRKYLVTQEEYEKEKEELKTIKLKEKERKRAEKEKKKNTKSRKILRIIGKIMLGIAIAFALYLLFGALLMALGY